MTSHSSIMAVLAEKHDKQKIELVDGFDNIMNLDTNVMLGSFSWYYMQERRKEVLRRFHLNFEGNICTPSELARTYLELKYSRQRAFKEQISEFKRARSAPLYAQPHKYTEGVYLDIRSAYWQILQIVGWNADYMPNKWLGRGDTMDDFPYADIKLSRNCLITAGLPSEGVFWHGKQKQYKNIKTQNRCINLGIWALTMDILHGAAWDAIRAGATYAHTDGYICDRSRLDAVQSALLSWGLETRIKAVGETQVYGVGSYTIGNLSTKTPKCKPIFYDGLILNPYNDWLRRRVKLFSEGTSFTWASSFQQVK